MAERVQVTGLKEVLQELKSFEEGLKRKALIAGSRKGALVFRRKIKSNIPKEKTGRLKNRLNKTFKVKQMSKRLKDVIGAMVYVKKTKEDWWWFLFEYGWIPSGRYKVSSNAGLSRKAFRSRNRRTREKKPGHFFVKKSFDSEKEKVKNSYVENINAWIKKYNGS